MSEADLYKFFSSYDGEADFPILPRKNCRIYCSRKAKRRSKKNILNIMTTSRVSR